MLRTLRPGLRASSATCQDLGQKNNGWRINGDRRADGCGAPEAATLVLLEARGLKSPYTHLAAASALSSGRVLKAIAAPGAALRTVLMTTSNNARCRGGSRTPAPMTTSSI